MNFAVGILAGMMAYDSFKKGDTFFTVLLGAAALLNIIVGIIVGVMK